MTLSRTDSSSSSFEQNSWSHNSRYLLTASRDWNVIIWDLSSAAFSTVIGERRNTIRFDAPVTSAALHPTNSFVPPFLPPHSHLLTFADTVNESVGSCV